MKTEMKQIQTVLDWRSRILHRLSRFYQGSTCQVLLTFSFGLMLMMIFGCGEETTPVKEVNDSQAQAMQDALLVSSVQAAKDVKSAETAAAVDKYFIAQDAKSASAVMKPVRLAPAVHPEEDDEDDDEAEEGERDPVVLVDIKLNLDGSVTLIKSDGSTVTVKLNLDGSLTVSSSTGQTAQVIIKRDEVIVIDAQGTAIVRFHPRHRAQVSFENGQTFTIDPSQGGMLQVTTDASIIVLVRVPQRGKVVIRDSTQLETEVDAQADGSFLVSRPSHNAQTQAVTTVMLLGQGRTEVRGHGKGHGSGKSFAKAIVENKGRGKAFVRHEAEVEQEIEIEVEDEDTVKVKVEGEKGAEVIIEVRSGETFEVHHEDGTTSQVEVHADGTFTVTTEAGVKVQVKL